MSNTVSSVLLDVGATVDQDTTPPTGTELLVRVRFADRAQKDWGSFYDWACLRSPTTPAVLASQTSLALSTRFSALGSRVQDFSTGVNNPTPYTQLSSPADRFRTLSTDKYCWILGDAAQGFSLQINPPLASGVSLVFDQVLTPSSLATTTDTITCPSTQFMSKRIEYYVLQARSDPRFPILKTESDDLLSQLVEDQDKPSQAQNNHVPTWMQQTNWVPGRD